MVTFRWKMLTQVVSSTFFSSKKKKKKTYYILIFCSPFNISMFYTHQQQKKKKHFFVLFVTVQGRENKIGVKKKKNLKKVLQLTCIFTCSCSKLQNFCIFPDSMGYSFLLCQATVNSKITKNGFYITGWNALFLSLSLCGFIVYYLSVASQFIITH